MSRKHALRFAAPAALAVVVACQDAPSPVAPSLPDPSPSVQRAEAAEARQARLAARFGEASAAVLAVAGTVFADHDEVAGKLVFGVEHPGVGFGVRNALSRLGLAESDYAIEVTKPIGFAVGLRDRFTSTEGGKQGGIQIHFSRYLCTLGFNVDGGTSFITNSHCTSKQGGVEGTTYAQPTRTVDPTVIATEVADPTYTKGGSCPKGKQCRYSDASRAQYSSGIPVGQGLIARTNAPDNNSLTVVGSFAITSQDVTPDGVKVGDVVNKVGRTTGWTDGAVSRTCVNTSVSGSTVMLYCQTFVNAGVGSGDSGSPVFKITGSNSVQLVGILWGGSSDNSTFVFSPLKQVYDELGTRDATN